MKYLAIFCLFMMILNAPVIASNPDIKTNNSCEGYIIIKGKTNINSFQLSQKSEVIVPYLLTSLNEVGSYSNRPPSILIPARRFKADNPLIYKDFLNLIKASEYPNIEVNIPHPGELSTDKDNRKIDISISIAGITKFYNTTCQLTACDEGATFLYGTQILHLTDFNIDPPEKTFGLIKVNDEVIINFGFMFAVH
jgi:hypothetical protein